MHFSERDFFYDSKVRGKLGCVIDKLEKEELHVNGILWELHKFGCYHRLCGKKSAHLV
jgi:hypothetical protein